MTRSSTLRSHSTDRSNSSTLNTYSVASRSCRSLTTAPSYSQQQHINFTSSSNSSSSLTQSSLSLDSSSSKQIAIIQQDTSKIKQYFQKSNSLDSGYKTINTPNTSSYMNDASIVTVDEENTNNTFQKLNSSSCSSPLSINEQKNQSRRIEFSVDDDNLSIDYQPSSIDLKTNDVKVKYKGPQLSITDLQSLAPSFRSRTASLSNYSISNYSVLLNEVCGNESTQSENKPSAEQNNSKIDNNEKINKKKSFIAAFFSSKKKDELTDNSINQEQKVTTILTPVSVTPTKKQQRSRSESETPDEQTTTKYLNICQTQSSLVNDEQQKSQQPSSRSTITATLTSAVPNFFLPSKKENTKRSLSVEEPYPVLSNEKVAVEQIKESETDLSVEPSSSITTTIHTISPDSAKNVRISTQSIVPQSQHSTSSFGTSALGLLHRLSNRFVPGGKHAAQQPVQDVISSTGLVFENRPVNLPPKSLEETLKHHNQYQKMCIEAKKSQLLYDEKDEKCRRLKLKREEFVSKSLKIWTNEILPYWEKHGIKTNKENSINTKAMKLWWHGLPPRIRGKIWKMSIANEMALTPKLFSELEHLAREKLNEMKHHNIETSKSTTTRSNHNEGDSLTLLSRPETGIESLTNFVELIQLDVSRTFPQLGLFQRNGPYHDYLEILLCTYVYLSPEIGYVQGQAFLAAMFLLNMDLYDSFVSFSNLLQRPYFQTFYRFNNIEKYLLLFEQLLNFYLPKLSEHFYRMSIKPNYFAFDWFFTIYSKSLPLDVVSRIWDIYYRDGDEFVFRTALGILALYEERLLNMDTFHCLQFLTKLPEDLNATQLFKSIETIKFDDLTKIYEYCPLFYLISSNS
ncbi:unnamed protein product [Didymodactylos carnosus]|uniref:Rab-GAP TBC domain-containing protein n=1 Tax=Didymodactylos carnosus TaxID=1234261 RepID=A0A814CJZ1_9BILA|nr:unnamed protein product [Didymodactylos carnosus]CAF0941251.1 unnamed protein product [Didymodactylos carnosus]CAF3524314.1 unnamed protein product [Didymodactylos carnosus]CAF3717726.1 unnamed protein product [Didymodactylos carnosus]